MSWGIRRHPLFKDLVEFSHRRVRMFLDLQYRSRLQAEERLFRGISLAPLKVLDFGAGSQDFFARHTCAQKWSVDPHEPATWSSLEQIPQDQKFDLIIATEVFEHVAEPAVVLQNLSRLQGEGQRLYLTTPFMAREHGAPQDYQRWTVQGLEVLFAQSDYKIEAIYKRGDFTAVVSAFFNHRLFELLHSRYFLVGLLFAPFVFVWLLVAHLTLRCSQKGNLYLGVSLLAVKR